MSNEVKTRKSFSGRTRQLQDLCISITDCHHSTPVWSDEGKIVVRNFNIKSGKLDLSSPFYTDEHTFNERIARAKPEAGDLIISREAPMGEVCVIPQGVECCLGQRMVLIKPDPCKVNSRYLLYAMLSGFVQAQINQSDKTGSIVSNLRIPLLKELEIPVIEGAEKIAAVLSTLDAKIDCNNRINAELEAMAKALYDYWFVQFDFPDANGKPYKSSGGKMGYSATLKREIPEEWEALQLLDVISRSGTGLNPRENFQLGNGSNYYVTIKNVTNGRIILDDKCDKIDDEALKIIDRRSQLQVGDVLFTSIEPVGVTYLIQKKPENWNINESVFTLRPDYKKTTSEHLFFLLSSDEMKVFTKNCSTGSIHKGIRHGVLKTYPLAYGGKKLIDEFSAAVKPMLKRMDVLEGENQQLAQLRDWLLPLLMNGQVTVV